MGSYFDMVPDNLVIHDFQILPSTQSYFLESLSYPTNDFTLIYCCVASRQTAGKGRSGKEWQSQNQENLYLSLAFPAKDYLASSFPLSVALSLSKLFETKNLNPRIKWPNDIIINEQKVAGILLNLRMINQKPFYVLGLGVNLNSSPALTKSIFPAGNIAEILGQKQNRDSWLADIITHLSSLIQSAQQSSLNFDPEEFRKYDCLLMRKIKSDKIEGIGHGIDSDGALLILEENKSEAHRVFSGEIQLND